VSTLDVVVGATDAGAVAAALALDPIVRAVATTPGRVRAQLYKSELPLEVTVVDPSAFGSALWRATGPESHVAALEARARGMSVAVAAREDELYERLGLDPVAPELRDVEDIAWAARRSRDLIELEDVQGLIHSHSTWSDGRASLLAMARAAQQHGFSYMTATDHGETAHYAGGMSREAILLQRAEIDAVNGAVEGVRVLAGVESDIREDGSLDYDEGLLEGLEVVIGSIHQRYKQDVAATTARVRRALRRERMHIWGHPTGRLIDKRDPAPMDLEALLETAAASGVAVEVNGSPERLDLSDVWARRALDLGVHLVVSADSHSEGELSNVRHAVRVARRAGARAADVLNTRSLADFRGGLR
jgi:DNA polymerase (family X)